MYISEFYYYLISIVNIWNSKLILQNYTVPI